MSCVWIASRAPEEPSRTFNANYWTMGHPFFIFFLTKVCVSLETWIYWSKQLISCQRTTQHCSIWLFTSANVWVKLMSSHVVQKKCSSWTLIAQTTCTYQGGLGCKLPAILIGIQNLYIIGVLIVHKTSEVRRVSFIVLSWLYVE